jgi:threonine-phosphate decarboxylase
MENDSSINNINFHGSDLEKIETAYGIKKEDIINYSSNINPLGISSKLKETLAQHVDAVTTYPDRNYKALRESIAQYTGSSPSDIVVGNGATELISLFLKITVPKNAVILGPAYSEYEREITLSGGAFSYFLLKEDDEFQLQIQALEKMLTPQVDLLVMCNPNNPTSTAISSKVIEQILKMCSVLHILVVIDETYVEFTDPKHCISAIPLIKQFKNLIILRGISKFFAAPGLRLGYAITSNPELIQKVHYMQNPWSVNTLADLGGTVMFSDSDFIKKTRDFIALERTRLIREFSALNGIKVFQPMANFVLLKILDERITSKDVFNICIRQGLMIRDCSSFESLGDRFIRVCFLTVQENNKLLRALQEIFSPETN